MISTGAHLRYGVLVDRPELSQWQVQVLNALDRVDGVECIGVHVTPRVDGVAEPSWRPTLNRLTFRRPRASGDVGTAVSRPRLTGPPDTPPDFWLQLAAVGVEPEQGAPLGTWRFFVGQAAVGSDAPAGLAEILADDPVTWVTVRRVDGAGPATVLAEAALPTVPHSLGRSRDQALTGAAKLPAQICRRLLRPDDRADQPAPPLERLQQERSPAAPSPTRSLAVRTGAKLTANWVRRQYQGLTRFDRWHVGYASRPISSFLDDPSLDDIVWLPRPEGEDRYVADPFGCPDGDAWMVLVEDYDHASRHGRISSYRLEADGSCGPPSPVAEFPGHASYPFLCQVGDEWWCIPETSADRKVEAFRFDPTTQEFHRLGVLLDDIALADPTLFEWQGRWWLFGTDRDDGANTHLRAWWADQPLGPWCPHAVDPLAIDVRSARGAGTPFVRDGQLYRPTQDCSTAYGAAVALTRLDRLDTLEFSQTVVGRVAPNSGSDYPDGVHTLSEMGSRTLIDAVVRRFSIRGFIHEVTARVRLRLPSPTTSSDTLEPSQPGAPTTGTES